MPGHRPSASAFRSSILVLLALVAAGCRPIPSFRHAGAPVAEGGAIDLRNWNFGRDGAVALVGAWDFFPGRLLSGQEALRAPREGFRRVPDLWSGADAGGEEGRGAGTYRLRVLLPASLIEPAIRYSTVSTAFELEADAVPIAAAGYPSADPSMAVAAYRPDVASLPRGESLVLVIRVSNHEYRAGGMWRPFLVGDRPSLERLERTAQAVAFAESAALATLAFSFFLFYVNRRRERAFLFFALLLLVISLRTLVTGEYILVRIFPSLRFDALIRLEYVSVFSAVPLAVHFFSSLFPDEPRRKLLLATLFPYAALVLLLPWVPIPLLTRTVRVQYAAAALAMAATTALVLVPALLHRRRDSVLEFAGALVLLIMGANDMLFSSFKIQTGNWFPAALLAFVCIQSYVLSRRYAAALDAAEALSAEKDILLKEVHHRVKNSLQIISSAIALQSHRSDDPALLAALAATRGRIRAISMVHEKLYSLDAPEPVDLGDYVRDLARQLEAGFRRDDGRVELAVEAERVLARQDFCIDFGLILTELLSNAYRHAKAGEGAVRVALRREGEAAVLRVEDDGPGFPPGFSLERPGGLGLTMVTSLARKRGGSLSIDGGPPGAIVELRMPIPGRVEAALRKEN